MMLVSTSTLAKEHSSSYKQVNHNSDEQTVPAPPPPPTTAMAAKNESPLHIIHQQHLYYNTHSYSSNNRLLRLNVGGHPYHIICTSLPLLETMMTDTYTYRWLDSCLLDSDGRIFLDRDGDAFGDVLRYLCGGKDFLLELMSHLVIVMELLVVIMFLIHHHAAGSLMSRIIPWIWLVGLLVLEVSPIIIHHPQCSAIIRMHIMKNGSIAQITNRGRLLWITPTSS